MDQSELGEMSNDGFYYEAASILESVRNGKGRIKSLCYNCRHRNKVGIFAIVTECCKNYKLLYQTLENSMFFKTEKKMKPNMAVILLHELVSDRITGSSIGKKIFEPILKNKTRLKAEYVKLKIKMPERKFIRPLRYVRVNNLVTDLEKCKEDFKKLGYAFMEDFGNSEFKNKLFYLDQHIPNLLVFPSGTDLTKTKLYKDGFIVLQDKASCMPVTVLSPPVGAHVIDACAAPGNKTTQLCAKVGTTGSVFAFERDTKRAEILQNSLTKHSCVNGKATCKDFLKVKPSEYPSVEYALVDPSCSGSGMLEEFENTDLNEENEGGNEAEDASRIQRLKSLANFQCMIIRHAMRFPNMKRVVYSTCSIHREENEDVVKEILASEPSFRLIQNPLQSWPRRGLSEYDFSNHVIRADPDLDRMNGFFVACFEKINNLDK